MAEKKFLIRIVANLDDARRGFQSIGREGVSSFRRLGRRAARVAGTIKNAFLSLPGLITSVFSGAAAKAAVDANILEERITNAMTAAAGGAQAAAEELAFVRVEADRLGFSYTGLAQSYTKLVAASRGTNLEGEKTREIFLGVAESAKSLSLSTEDTKGILRAVEQVMSKGTVQAEELRGQMGERLPGAFQTAARAMGVTTEELSKMLELGEVSAEDLLPKMAAEMRKAASTNLASAIADTSAELGRFKTFTRDALRWLDDKTGLTYHFRNAIKAIREFGNELMGVNEDKALEIFREQIEPNIELLRSFGIEIANIDPSNLEHVNRVLRAAALNNIDLAKQARLGELEAQLNNAALAYDGLLVARQAIINQLGEESQQYQDIQAKIEANRDNVGRLAQAYTDLATGQKEAAESGDDLTDSQEGVGKAVAMAEEVIRATFTETEQLSNTILRLNALFLAGHLSVTDYSNAILAARQQTSGLNAELEAEAELWAKVEEITRNTRTPLEQVSDEIAVLNALWQSGKLGAEAYAAAVQQAQKSLGDLSKEGDKDFQRLERAVQGWGREFTDALTDAMVTGKGEFDDLAEHAIRALLRIQIQKRITDPFVKAGTSFLDGLFNNTTTSANSNVMTGRGPMPLKTYARGGIARSPQLSIFGEGSQPEAYVPLPDGRSIPVSMKGGASAMPTQIVEVHNYSGQPVREERSNVDGKQMVRLFIGEAAADVRRGGELARAINDVTGTRRPGARVS